MTLLRINRKMKEILNSHLKSASRNWLTSSVTYRIVLAIILSGLVIQSRDKIQFGLILIVWGLMLFQGIAVENQRRINKAIIEEIKKLKEDK